jgi:hypothetical protein
LICHDNLLSAALAAWYAFSIAQLSGKSKCACGKNARFFDEKAWEPWEMEKSDGFITYF